MTQYPIPDPAVRAVWAWYHDAQGEHLGQSTPFLEPTGVAVPRAAGDDEPHQPARAFVALQVCLVW